MSGTSEIKKYLNQIMTDVLPSSNIELLSQNKIGLYKLDATNSTEWVHTPESTQGIYSYEKSAPKKIGITSDGESFKSVYFKQYEQSMLRALSNIIVNSALEIYPTPLHTYGTVINQKETSIVGLSSIDLNHLKDKETNTKVDSIRLDYLLHSLGLGTDIDSFLSFQKMLESGKLSTVMTPRAIVQLGLSSIFIPNAIGETDVNSRNIILLKDIALDKYDIVTRIDADKNEYIFDLYKYGDSKAVIPKGIYLPNEDEDTYLKAISHKDIGIDWDLFSGFTYLADQICSRSRIDNAITTSYRLNSVAGNGIASYKDFYMSHYNTEAFFDFSEATICRAKKYFNNVHNAIQYIKTTPPFAEVSSKYGNLILEELDKKKYIQSQFDKNGKEL